MRGLGEKVSFYRKSKGLSIKALAENICDESTIYRLEQGKQLPRLEILNDICLKLELPFQSLFPYDDEIENLKDLCREFTYLEDYLSLELVLESCEELLLQISSRYVKSDFNKFIQWHKAILLHKKDQDPQNALCLLNSLVSIEKCGSELDISIMNSIGLIYLSLNKTDVANVIYKTIFEKVKKRKVMKDVTLLPRVGYNYAATKFKLKEYNHALEIANHIHYYLESNYLIYLLGEVNHMIATILKKGDEYKEAEIYFNKAILVFSLTNNERQKVKAENDLFILYN